MGSKKIAAITFNYSELFKRCPANQARNLKRVQELAKTYLERVDSLPAELPPINWEYYKMNVRKEYLPMVDEFQKLYTEFKVPYPEDTYKQQFEQMAKEIEADIRDYKEKSNVRIAYYECLACHLMDIIPFEEMTMEDFADTFPDHAPDYINKPTFWPHTPEEQLQPVKEGAETDPHKSSDH